MRNWCFDSLSGLQERSGKTLAGWRAWARALVCVALASAAACSRHPETAAQAPAPGAGHARPAVGLLRAPDEGVPAVSVQLPAGWRVDPTPPGAPAGMHFALSRSADGLARLRLGLLSQVIDDPRQMAHGMADGMHCSLRSLSHDTRYSLAGIRGRAFGLDCPASHRAGEVVIYSASDLTVVVLGLVSEGVSRDETMQLFSLIDSLRLERPA
jgi:hypothetical protein